ncbi:HMG-Y-related protein A [Quillaja saponaria]|uniref:HMG-Y-related protein A n=1 Tax=Quillaja saponaria TaxID=32244 RepID=A0AAD7PGR7_QUISA|nr:HMG-Y-related protein A [Quillaja saponaria]
MASEESNNPCPLAPPLPEYPEMIMAAIEALNEKEGSSRTAISKHIESTHGDLPAAHSTLLSHHLNKMIQSNQLILLKDNYIKPVSDAMPKRGRGRPPKPKVPLSEDTVVSLPRPRGRPPKPRDPLAPPPEPKKKTSTGSGRPRGRPRKAPTTVAAPTENGAPRRGRGRPPKVKPAVTPVAG